MSDNKNILTHRLSLKNRLYRLFWNITWIILIRPIPRTLFNGWKILILRFFGAKISSNVIVYSSAKIYMPCNLIMKQYSVLGDNVDCYNVDTIEIGEKSIVSQKSYLCTASHTINDDNFTLITAPIYLGINVWIAADAFVGMGVTVGNNSVVGARSSVFKDVPSDVIVGGNPAKIIKRRQSTQNDHE